MLLKKLYNLIPFKKQLFVVIRAMFTPGKELYQHLHFKGVFKVKVKKEHSFLIKHYGYELENDLFWTGIENGWEKESMKWWTQLCKNSNVILDVGANTGVFSLVARCVNPNAKIFAFEPVPMVFDKLKTNCIINNYDIFCSQLALSNKSGIASIFLPESEHVYSVTIDKNLNKPSVNVTEQKVETVTLSDFVKKQKVNKIDLMKIDVETHEYEVLEGMGDYLQEMQPTMLIEILNNVVAKKVQSLLDKCDYVYFDVNESGKTTLVNEINASSSFNYLVCNKNVAKQLQLVS